MNGIIVTTRCTITDGKNSAPVMGRHRNFKDRKVKIGEARDVRMNNSSEVSCLRTEILHDNSPKDVGTAMVETPKNETIRAIIALAIPSKVGEEEWERPRTCLEATNLILLHC